LKIAIKPKIAVRLKSKLPVTAQQQTKKVGENTSPTFYIP
jgi:hypothetical protein